MHIWQERRRNKREGHKVELESLTAEMWSLERRRLLNFAVRFGDKRLTVAAFHTLRRLVPSMLDKDISGVCQAIVVVAKQGSRIVGMGFASEEGEAGCIVVVHPNERGCGVGSAIMEAMILRLGRLTCNVALDNIASMALCFRLGMSAVAMHKGPTGKATLRFERGFGHDTACSRHIDFISQ